MIRTLDLFFSITGVILLMPLFLLIGIIIKFSSKGPVFYMQSRVGRNGVPFKIYKFRTMRINSDREGLLTVGGRDPRVTILGYYLRHFKLDELPQLFNVIIGEMSIVGPRPEVKRYVDLYSDSQKKVLLIRPGITDWASIYYRNENIILGDYSEPEKHYIEKIIPIKINYNLIYIENYGVIHYFKILLTTILYIIIPHQKK